MNRSIITTPSNQRVFGACLLSFMTLIAPIASVGAATLRATAPAAAKAATKQLSPDEKLEAALFEPALALPPVPAITATKTDTFPVHPSGKAQPGDQITYDVAINNAGTDAANTIFTDTIDPNTTLVPGSLKVSPVAAADSYVAEQSVALSVGAPGVLTNDYGTPAPTVGGIVGCLDVTAPFTCTTTGGGTVVLAADGSFTYTPLGAFTGADTFIYTSTNSAAGGLAPDDTATVTITVDARPTVTTTTPTNGATNQATNTNIVVNFSEPVTASTSSFTIECPAPGNLKTFTVSGSGTSTITLDPTVDLPAATTCTVTVIANQISDVDSNDPPDNMAADYVFSFTTDAPPSVTTTTPTNTATGVATNTNIVVNFSEPVTATTSSFTIECPAPGNLKTYTVTGSGTSAITLDPSVDLPTATLCTVTVIATQIHDTDTNDPPDTMTANYVFSFTTDAAPSVTTTVPTDTATGVPTNSNITINFSEPVTASTSSFTINCPFPGNLQTFTVSGSGTSTITLDPTVDLPIGTVCRVTVIANQISDTDTADPPDNMAANYVFNFTTDFAPTVSSTVPTNGATTVATNTNITINFSEPVSATTSSFTIECPNPGNLQTFAVSGSGTSTITLDPTADLPVGTICTVTVIANQISDTDTNDPPDNMVANFVFSFTTDFPPSVSTTTPTNGATGVAANTNITINFSEAVTATTSSFTIECPTPGNLQAFAVSGSGTSAIVLNPTADLPPGTICTVTVIAAQISDTDAGDPPDNMAANYVFSFSVPPVAVNDSYAPSILGNVGINTDNSTEFTVLTNDTPNTGVTINQSGSSTQGGTVVVAADGKFTYTPPAGYEGADTFTYTISNAAGTSNSATVSFTVAGMIWFINAAAGAGDGRLATPFSSVASFQAINDNAGGTHPGNGDNIFIYENAASYTGPITLLSNQKLIGQDATATLAAIAGVSVPADSFPLPAMNTGAPATTLNNSTAGSNAVNLNSAGTNNTVRGMTITTGSNTSKGINGSTFGTLTVADLIISGSGPALDLTTGTLAGSFNSISSSGGANGIRLSAINSGSTISFGTGALSGATADEFLITGTNSTIALTYDGTISTSAAAAKPVNISGKTTAGSVTFNGAVSSTGAGVNLDNNDGATITFRGGLSLTTTTNTAFNAINGGTIEVCDENPCNPAATGALVNTLTTTTGTALNVNTTNISSNRLEFRSINVTGNNTLPSSGIILNTTGAAGGLKVSGNGGSCTPGVPTCTGGTIQGTGSHGIFLTSTQHVVLNLMSVHNTGDHGIKGDGVNNFTLADSIIFNFGNTSPAAGTPEDGIRFDNSSFPSTAGHGLTGTAIIQRVTIGPDGNFVLTPNPPSPTNSGLVVRNWADTNLTMTLTGTKFTQVSNDGVDVQIQKSTGTLNVDGSTADGTNTFDQINGFGVRFKDSADDDANGILELTIKNNTFSNIGGGAEWIADGGTTLNARFNNNTMSLVKDDAVRPVASASGAFADPNIAIKRCEMNATISNNNMGGGTVFATAIRGCVSTMTFGSATVGQGNTNIGNITQPTYANYGRTTAFFHASAGARMNVDVLRNTMVMQGGAQIGALYFQVVDNGGGDGIICANAMNNVITGNALNSIADIVIDNNDSLDGSKIHLEGWGGGTTASSTAFLTAQNTLNDSTKVTYANAANAGIGDCVTSVLVQNNLLDQKEFLARTNGASLFSETAKFAPTANRSALLDVVSFALANSQSPSQCVQGVVQPIVLSSNTSEAVKITKAPPSMQKPSQPVALHSTISEMARVVKAKVTAEAQKIVQQVAPRATSIQPVKTAKAQPSFESPAKRSANQTFSHHASLKARPSSLKSTTPAKAATTMAPVVNPTCGSGDIAICLGTLRTGRTVNIQFKVTVNTPFPSTQVSNQGTVSGSNFSNVLTDDPSVVGTSDPTVTPVQTCTPPPANMTSWWTGDNTPRDISGGHDGTLNGAGYAAGKVLNGFNFDGIDDYVDIGDVDLPSTFTIDAWVNPTDLTSERAIVNKDNGTQRSYFFHITTTGALRALVQSGGGIFTQYQTAAGVVTAGSLQHVAVTYNGAAPANQKMLFYKNGALVASTVQFSQDNGGTPENVGLAARIGRAADGASPFFGLIDEVELFNVVLTPAQVLDIYSADSGGKCKPSDLKITKTHTDPFVQGSTGNNYTITVHNDGPATTSGTTTVTDQLPAGLTATALSGSGWSCTSMPVTGPNTLTCTSTATIASGADFPVITLTVTAGVNTPSVTNTVTVSGGGEMDTSDDTANDLTNLTPSADLEIASKVDAPDPVTASTNITYTINFINNGPSNAQTVTVTDAVPAGTTFVSASFPAGWGRTDAVAGGGTGNVVFAKATVASGETAVFTMVVQVNANAVEGSLISNTATAASANSDPTPGNNSKTATTTVNQSDIEITSKTDAPDPVIAGSNITYTVNFKNNSAVNPASNVTMTDAVPANTTLVSATTVSPGWARTDGVPVGGTGNIVFSKALVAASETAVFTIVVKVNTSVTSGTIITNTATAATTSLDTVSANNSASATTTVQVNADLQITSKTDTPDPVTASNNITYAISFVNNGPSDGQGVTITDAVPSGTTFVSAQVTTGSGWTIPSPPAVGGTGNVVFSKTIVPTGETATFEVVVKVNNNAVEGSIITNNAVAAGTTNDPTPGNNTGTATTTVNQSDIEITSKTDTPDPVTSGQNITYTVNFKNNSAVSSAANVTVTDAVPTGTTLVSATTASPGWARTDGVPVGGTGNIVFSKALVAASETAVFTIVVKVNASVLSGSTITNTATAATTSIDTNSANNSASATTTTQASADLQITSKTDLPDPVIAGENITYTINFINNGPSNAQTVTVTDAVPANTTFVSAAIATGTGWTIPSPPAVGGTGNVVFSKATVAAAETATFTVVVKVNSNTPAATLITNNAVAASATTDPTPANNTGTATTTVATSADLLATKIDSPDPVVVGTNLTYTITVTNNGSSDAQTLQLSDTLPPNTTFVSFTVPGGWTRTDGVAVGGTGTVTATAPTLASGASAVFTLVVNVNLGTPHNTVLTNSATVTTTTNDPNLVNNTGTTTTTVNSTLALTVNDSGDAADNNLGDRICDTNAAPGDQCTLRAAIQETNAAVTADTIGFSLPANSTIVLGSLLPDISGDLTVTGPASGVTVSGNNSNRVFSVQAGKLVSLSNLTIADGWHSVGGGINSGGNLTISNCTLTRNEAVGPADEGGAIYAGAGTLTIINSTISGNTATNNGGGIVVGGNTTATLVNVTITNNRAVTGLVGPPAVHGGGIIKEFGSNPITLRNTIVAGNFAGTGPGTPDDLYAAGPVDPASNNNLFGTGGSGGLTNGVNNNQVGVVDARLGPLASNGGPTQTHALLSGSVALDAGDDSVTGVPFSLTTDQRGTGFPRKADGPDSNTTQTVDIGAFEADPSVEDISDKSTNEDTALPTFNFNVGDAATPFTSITGTSSNTTLVPNANIVIGPNTASTRTLSITPAANQFGTATITVTVTRGTQSMSDTFILTVNGVNDPPSFTKGADQTVAEDSGAQSVPGWATFISQGPGNESGQTLTFVVQTNTNSGLFAAGPAISPTGTLTYTPAADANGSATITIVLMDNGGGANTSPSQQFVITVTEVNDAPDAVNDALSNVAEDSGMRTITIASLLGNDNTGPANESGQTLTFSLVGGSGVGGTVTSDATNVYFTPSADFNGAASFQYMVTDNGTTNGAANPKNDTATASFTVTEVNDAPTAVNDTIPNSAEDSGPRTILASTLTGNDSKGPGNESGQTLIIKTVGSAVGGTVSIVSGNVVFTPTADYNGPASFQYTVEDNGTTNGAANPLTSGSATVSFNITEVNDAPDAVDDGLSSVVEDSSMQTIPIASLLANDTKGPANESGQTLTLTGVSNPIGGTVSSDATNVYFTPAADFNGVASFQYTVTDNGTTNGAADPRSDTATVSFTVTEVNDAPVAVNDPLGDMAEDAPQRTIPFSVLTANDSPGPANESGQTLIVKTVSNPVGITVSIVAGTVRFTPLPDYNGPASFRYTVEDNGTTNGVADPKTSATSALAHFNITEVNDAPTAVNDTLPSIPEDSGPMTIPFASLTANDSKGPANESSQTLTVKTVSNPIGGTVSIVAGNVVFTPTANFNGTSSFDYTVEDNGTTNGVADPKTSGTATVTFANIAVADTPSVTNATTNANTQTTSGLVISRNPADGAEVTHFKITAITGGLLFKNNGTTPINNGDFITFAEGNAGLKFTPGTVNGSFLVQASLSASDAGLGGGTVQATIIINPLGGVIRFSAVNYNVAEGAGFRTITVERSGDTSQAVTVDYASSDHSTPADFVPCTAPGVGFASSRCDFTTAIGTLRFAAGETSKTFNVLISNDNYVEGPETLELTLSNATNGAVFGVPQTAILTITDDLTEPATNPINNAADFVRAQYHDVLGREPDGPGLAFWTDNIEKCNDPARRPAGQTVAQCIDKQRESTAIAFFMSPEFQMAGGFVYHLYKGSLTGTPNYDGGSPGRFPTFLEFMRDMGVVSEGIVVNNQISGAVVEANRNRLATAFVQRPEFVAKYGGLNNTLYVQELFNTTGIAATAAQKQALVDGLTNGTETRASVLRKVVDGTVVISESNVQFTTPYGQAFINQENRRLFVYLEYVGYLRRNPDTDGFVFWLGKLNFFNGDPFQAEMVRSFILSPEYRSRFGQP